MHMNMYTSDLRRLLKRRKPQTPAGLRPTTKKLGQDALFIAFEPRWTTWSATICKTQFLILILSCIWIYKHPNLLPSQSGSPSVFTIVIRTVVGQARLYQHLIEHLKVVNRHIFLRRQKTFDSLWVTHNMFFVLCSGWSETLQSAAPHSRRQITASNRMTCFTVWRQ